MNDSLVEWCWSHLAELLVSHGVAAAAADRMATRFCDDLRGMYGGDHHYVARGIGPKGRAERDDSIRVAVLVNGKPISRAAREFGLSETQVRRICEPR